MRFQRRFRWFDQRFPGPSCDVVRRAPIGVVTNDDLQVVGEAEQPTVEGLVMKLHSGIPLRGVSELSSDFG